MPTLPPALLLLGSSGVALAGPHTAMVGFSQGPEAVLAAADQHGARVRGCYQVARFCVLDFPGPPPLPLLAALPGVRYAEADRLVPGGPAALYDADHADAAGTADCDDPWELLAVGADAAWESADGSDGPVVAIADAGFLASHEELVGHITGQFDYGNLDGVAEVEWDAGVPAHGTFIAALVAGTADNGVGRAGLAPGAGLNLLKIADSTGALYFSYAASALADVADGDLGIRAVNYSIASDSYSASFADAVDALAAVDVVLVAAAGNCSSAHCADADNDDHPLYPASFPDDHVISVAGSTRDGGYNSDSHYGARSVDLAAPGVDLCSAGVESTRDYFRAAGTSYAAPLVAATVALLLETHPDLTPLELARVLRASAADHPDWTDRVVSGGVLDAAAALDTAVPRLDPPADLRLDGLSHLDLPLENAGAAGEATIVLGHGPAFEVVGASAGWTVEPFATGEVLDLPDAGEVRTEGAGTLLRAPLDAHRATTLRLELAGRELGEVRPTVRLVLASAGAAYLHAPYDEGETDATGFLALPFTVEVTAIAPDGSGEDSGGTGDGGSGDGGSGDGGSGDGGSGDGGSSDGGAGDGGAHPPAGDDDGGGKGGCSVAPAGATVLVLPGLLLPLRRRRAPGT